MATASRAGDGVCRFEWEARTRPLVESTINEAFRLWDLRWTADCKSEVHLDRVHGVDIVGVYANGQPLTFQAKCLSTNYTTLTIDGENRHTGQLGDWCECLADYLVYLYSLDGEHVDRGRWYPDHYSPLRRRRDALKWQRQNPDSSRHNAGSCFYFVELTEVVERAPECIRARNGDWWRYS